MVNCIAPNPMLRRVVWAGVKPASPWRMRGPKTFDADAPCEASSLVSSTVPKVVPPDAGTHDVDCDSHENEEVRLGLEEEFENLAPFELVALDSGVVRAQTLDSFDAILGGEEASGDDRVVDEPAAGTELATR